MLETLILLSNTSNPVINNTHIEQNVTKKVEELVKDDVPDFLRTGPTRNIQG